MSASPISHSISTNLVLLDKASLAVSSWFFVDNELFSGLQIEHSLVLVILLLVPQFRFLARLEFSREFLTRYFFWTPFRENAESFSASGSSDELCSGVLSDPDSRVVAGSPRFSSFLSSKSQFQCTTTLWLVWQRLQVREGTDRTQKKPLVRYSRFIPPICWN